MMGLVYRELRRIPGALRPDLRPGGPDGDREGRGGRRDAEVRAAVERYAEVHKANFDGVHVDEDDGDASVRVRRRP